MFRINCPSDVEQRNGRILRRGNENKHVRIFRYVTDRTFDAYSFQILENKQKFISQAMTGQIKVKRVEDVQNAELSYAEAKALCAGNPDTTRGACGKRAILRCFLRPICNKNAAQMNKCIVNNAYCV